MIKFHDIKNPASAIKGLIELLESYDLTATEQQEIMESLVASSSSLVLSANLDRPAATKPLGFV